MSWTRALSLSLFQSFIHSFFRSSVRSFVWDAVRSVTDDNSIYIHAYSIIITFFFVWFIAVSQMEWEWERCGDYCYLFSSFGDSIYLLGFYSDFTILCASKKPVYFKENEIWKRIESNQMTNKIIHKIDVSQCSSILCIELSLRYSFLSFPFQNIWYFFYLSLFFDQMNWAVFFVNNHIMCKIVCQRPQCKYRLSYFNNWIHFNLL